MSSPTHITFLGTGTSTGVPVISCNCKVCTSKDPRDNRLRSSILINIENKNIVIDSGPDFRQQMLTNKVNDISAIVYTHEHRDHVSGLDDVRPFNFIHKKHINVYAEERVLNAIKHDFSYIFTKDRYPGVPKINLHLVSEQPFFIENVKFTPIRAFHNKLPLLGYRVGNFAYMTDVKTVPKEELFKLEGLEVLAINALRKDEHLSHMNLDESLGFIEKVKPSKAYLTHLGHTFGLHAVEEPLLPQNVSISYDGLKISVS